MKIYITLCLMMFLFCIPFSHALPTGLIALWKGEDNGNDSVGSNTLTLLNGVSFVNGISGKAFYFDGVNDAANASYAPALSGTSSFTYNLWMNVISFSNPNGDGDYFMDRTTPSLPLVGLKANSSGQYYWQIRNDSATTLTHIPGGNIVLNQWQNVTIVRQYGVAFRFYLNGVKVNEISDTIGTITPPAPRFGGHTNDPNYFFQGMVDEISIYNRALTSEEIATLSIPEASNIILMGLALVCAYGMRLWR